MISRKTTHGLFALALALAGIALLAGCPDNNAKGGSTPSASAGATGSAAPAAAGSATAGSGGNGW